MPVRVKDLVILKEQFCQIYTKSRDVFRRAEMYIIYNIYIHIYYGEI